MTIKIPALLLALVAVSAQAQTTTPRPAAPAANAPPARAQAAQPGEMPTPERMFADWDTDKNKQLSLQEFTAGVERARVADMIARLEQQFRKADANNSKKLEAAEYSALPAMKRAGASAPPLSTFDTNKDQAIDFQEFLGMVQAFIRKANGGQ